MTDDQRGWRRLELVERAASVDMLLAGSDEARRAAGLQVVTVADGSCLIAANVPSILFNRVVGLGTTGPVSGAEVDAIVELYRAAGVPKLWVHVEATCARPDELRELLGARGFERPRRTRWVKLVRGTEPPPRVTTQLVVHTLDATHAEAYGRVVLKAYELPAAARGLAEAVVGRPGWRCYGAFEGGGGEIVGVGALFLDGDAGYLSCAATDPAARGRGAQSALIARRIEDAIALGCETICVETGEPIGDEKNPSLDNLERAGFRRAFTRENHEKRF
jgi:ribosomal protein S18 acetylase RimI-like enzyme